MNEHEHLEHGHDHHHEHDGEAASREEQVALLAYMLHHNEHHAEELHDLAHSIGGPVAECVHEAVRQLELGNEKLAEALELMQKEQ